MNLKRGLLAGFSCGLAGLIGLPLAIAGFKLAQWTFNKTNAIDRQYDIAWWQEYALPGMLTVIPMFLFFAGFVTYAPDRYCGFAKSLAILVVTTIPLSVILGELGMRRPRKSIEHLTMSEVLMFFIPIALVSLILLLVRSRLPRSDDSVTG